MSIDWRDPTAVRADSVSPLGDEGRGFDQLEQPGTLESAGRSVSPQRLAALRMGIGTYMQPVVFMREDCSVCRAEGFEAPARIEVRPTHGKILATLNTVKGDRLEAGQLAKSPYLILEKERPGDRDVSVSLPEVERWRHHTPVVVDDIISTARTMIEAVEHLRDAGMRPPVCIGVHGVFAEGEHDDLLKAGAARIVTTNTIAHSTNAIGVVGLLAGGVSQLTAAAASECQGASIEIQTSRINDQLGEL